MDLVNFFYSLFLSLHNITRWLVIGFGVWALIRAYSGWFKKLEWSKSDDRAGILFTSMIDLQVLLGLLLYFLFSPAARQLVANFSMAMRIPDIRFFGMEHVFIMVIAMIVAHVGRTLSKKAKTAGAQHRIAAISFSLTILIILGAIPWPFLSNYGRPLFRLFGLAF
jgi:hypothetical protein